MARLLRLVPFRPLRELPRFRREPSWFRREPSWFRQVQEALEHEGEAEVKESPDGEGLECVGVVAFDLPDLVGDLGEAEASAPSLIKCFLPFSTDVRESLNYS